MCQSMCCNVYPNAHPCTHTISSNTPHTHQHPPQQPSHPLTPLHPPTHTGDRPGLALAAPDILCMLITWTHDCQPAITSLLAAAAHIPCLLDILSGRLGTPHPLTRGLAALLLGVCVLYGTPTDAEGVRGAIGQRVGASEVLGVLGGMQEDPLWVEGGRVPLVDRAREAALNGVCVGGGGVNEGGGGEEFLRKTLCISISYVHICIAMHTAHVTPIHALSIRITQVKQQHHPTPSPLPLYASSIPFNHNCSRHCLLLGHSHPHHRSPQQHWVVG